MDMSEKKQETMWLFPDTDSSIFPIHGIFKSCEEEIAKNGSMKFPVVTLDNAGQALKISRWRLDCNPCLIKWGNDSEKWKGQLCRVNKNEKGKLSLSPIEEDLQR